MFTYSPSEPTIESPFKFDDEYFANDIDKDDTPLADDLPQELNLCQSLGPAMASGKFHILHLNINSAFNKFEHFLDVLNLLNVDIITLNETKLDDETPDYYFEHPNSVPH